MRVIRSISETRRFCRNSARPFILVPTMGALHAGHLSLARRARQLAGPAGTVAVSIFVNPTQFGPREDFTQYPRTFEEDRRVCASAGVDLIFCPSTAEMYPEGFSTYVEETTVSAQLCGASRPGHFRGVCTVVLKLFEILQPDTALFGLKDFQQCVVIRRMTRDLNLPIRVIPAPTVRERDGLALSSRNRYLSADERAQAPVLRRALLAAREDFRAGETSAAQLRARMRRVVATAPLAELEYAEVADADSLHPLRKVGKNFVCALAARFGTTRLIDNLWIR